MSSIFLNPQTSSPIPFLELKGDQQHNFQVFGHVHDHDLATSSNNSCLSYNNNSHNSHSSQEMLSFDYSRHAHSKVEKLMVSHEKTSDLGQPYSSWLQSAVGDNSGCSYDYSFHLQGVEKIETDDDVRNKYDDDDHHQNYNSKYSKKWKPSKLRIMQKMMTSSPFKNSGNSTKQQLDHLPKQQRQNNGDGIRVCSDCHTTTTPLWRSGPQGPKSLCNACGIRQRKARRAAMAAAAAAGFGNNDATAAPPVSQPGVEARKSTNKAHDQITKPERGLIDHDKTHTLPIKKRSKLIDAARNSSYYNYNNNNYTQNSHNNNNNNNNYNNNDEEKLCYEEDIAMSSNKDYYAKPNNPKRGSFPRDEEEGAILLMALSCGLACSS